jgi:hypothetical protein
MPAIRWTSRRRAKFIKELAKTGNVSAAARAAGVSRSHAYALRASESGLSSEWADALEAAVDTLEEEARRRAIDGIDSPHFHQGQVTGTVKKYSDSLLMFLLKAHRPERYRERAAETPDQDTDRAEDIASARDDLETRIADLDPEAEPDGT